MHDHDDQMSTGEQAADNQFEADQPVTDHAETVEPDTSAQRQTAAPRRSGLSPEVITSFLAGVPWQKVWFGTAIFALLVVGWYVRSLGVFSQTNRWMHPDENRMNMAVNEVRKPNWDEVLSAGNYEEFKTAMEPLNPHFFAYGSFTIYLYRFSSEWASNGQTAIQRTFGSPPEFPETFILLRPFVRGAYDGLQTISSRVNNGRFWSIFFGTATILVTFAIARTFLPTWAALLAAAFLCLNVLHLQLSRFLTSDVTLVFWMMAALLNQIRLARDGRITSYLLAGPLIGIAFATKLNALVLFGTLGLAHVMYVLRQKQVIAPGALLRWGLVMMTVGLAGVTFLVLEPFALLDYSEFRRQMVEESMKVGGGGFPPPYMIQFFGTPSFIFQVEQMFAFGFGPVTGLLVLLGAIWGVFSCFWRFSVGRFFVVFWSFAYFFAVGELFVKWMRHMLPIYPTLCIIGAMVVHDLWRHGQQRDAAAQLRWKRVAIAVGSVTFLWTSTYAAAFLDIYRNPNTRHKASAWIYDNVPRGSKVLTEHWDEGLPVPVRGGSPGHYPSRQLENYEPEDPQRIRKLVNDLAWADYIFINSKRLYHSIPRDPRPDRVIRPNFYRLLFSEQLGFELVKTITSYPTIFGWEYNNDLAEESFSVYDHPKALIFKKSEDWSADDFAQRLYDPPADLKEQMPLKKMLLARESGVQPARPILGGFSFRFLDEDKPEEKREYKRSEILSSVESGPGRNAFQGGQGSGLGQFIQPRDIARDAEGNFYVADFRNFRIQKFGPSGDFLLSWGTEGSKFGQFKDPHGVAVTPDGRVVVVDSWNHRLQFFDGKGKFLEAVDGEMLTMFAPTDIVFAEDGTAYVSDSGNARILRASPGFGQVREWGSRGVGDGQLSEPKGMLIKYGRLHVADYQNGRVQVWGLDGTYLTAWDLPQKMAARPTYLASGEGHLIYVADSTGGAIWGYDKEGVLVARSPAGKRIEAPHGMELVGDDLIVVEHATNRLIKLPLSSFEPMDVGEPEPGTISDENEPREEG